MFDTIIIGGGPAGYLAAERLGHKMKNVLLIEQRHLGGTCLNAGCIPTKTLLNSAKLYVHAKEAKKFGVNAEGVSYDWNAIQNWKNEVIIKLRGGIEGVIKRAGARTVNGRGEIISPPSGGKPAKVKSVSPDGKENIHEGKTVLVCSGSVPVTPPIPGSKDNPLVVDSTALLSVNAVPKNLAIIGGGVIGIEFAGLFSALGSKVTVIEMMDEIIPFMDRELSPILRKAMSEIDFKLSSKVEKIENGKVFYLNKKGEQENTDSDLILLAAGRRPVLDNWGAREAGIYTAKNGVHIDDYTRTNINGIWAAGDVTGKSLLAHCAYRMGEVAAADITAFLDGDKKNKTNKTRYDAIPWAVYGITEAAGAGITEQEAKARGIEIIKASLPMKVSGRFAAENSFSGAGAVKVIADAANRRVLGVHAVGAYSPEFIWGACVLIEQEFSIEDVKQLIFPHPTVSELIKDVMWEL
ncbi:MAG: dihydrolipoyl dehydrogenase [Treponema sp.]|nr:dihydrolipoyl dehydrogenase [Treponema sp.]